MIAKHRAVFFFCSWLAFTGTVAAEEWPQWRGPHRDGVWPETGLLERFRGPQLALKWSVPLSSGYSGPTVAAGRVYVMDRTVEPRQVEGVHCFDWQTGQTIWSHQYDCAYVRVGYQAGPRASVLIDEGRAYSLGTMGHLYCFDAADGAVLWTRALNSEFGIRMPNWGISAAPIVVGDLVIVQIGGAGDACVAAFDKRTGERKWNALPDDASYSAPLLVRQGETDVLVCWTGSRVTGLNPLSGSLLWAHDFPWERWPIGIATPVSFENGILVSDAHKGTLLLELAQNGLAVTQKWHRRVEDEADGKALHCLISTPYIDGQYIYGCDGGGVLRCLRLDTGDQVWQDTSAVPPDRWATVHMVRNGDKTWLFNERGELIIARLTPEGYQEISRAALLDPTTVQLPRRGGVTWSHPAFAYRHVFARNDKQLVCADLSASCENDAGP
ncbi:MAG: dehydrogenase [Planctomycetes bacterium]|nr:dehydrogenase [Planctomycetota bacterium]